MPYRAIASVLFGIIGTRMRTGCRHAGFLHAHPGPTETTITRHGAGRRRDYTKIPLW
jgi:hypothetical protein